MKKAVLTSVIFLVSLSLSAQNGTIVLEVNGVENTLGSLFIGLFHNEGNFPDYGHELIGKRIIIQDLNSIQCTFENLEDGRYALAIWHDENNNEALDANLFGMPIEKYGFSNDVGTFGKPDFEDAAFFVKNGKETKLIINLK